VRIAIATNRRLQAEYERLGIAAAEVASATVLRPLEVDIEIKPAHDELELDVIQDIMELIQLPQRRGVARAELAAARARAVAVTVALIAEVEAAFVDVVAAQQELELRNVAFDATAAAADLAERMRAAGNIPELTLLRERDSREQARIELARAQVDVEVAREALNELLGLSGEATRWTVVERLPDLPGALPDLDQLERDAIAQSLDLQAIRGDAEAAAGRVGLARGRAVLPVLGVGVAVERSFESEWHVGPALRIGLPLFDQQQGPRARANAELRRSRNEAIATAVEVRARVRAVRQRVLGNYAEARQIRDVLLPQRQRILDETLKQYNAMNATVFDLIFARRELVAGGQQYIDALRRFWRSAADARALARGAMPRTSAIAPVAPTVRPTREDH
jgi:outer membrane protein, heavy metal efflux system